MTNFDLEDRTTAFGVAVVKFCRKLPSRDPVNVRLIPQLVASAGSIGANYREANDALGKKDFINAAEDGQERSQGNNTLAGYVVGGQPQLR